jgi:hypothetical protein
MARSDSTKTKEQDMFDNESDLMDRLLTTIGFAAFVVALVIVFGEPINDMNLGSWLGGNRP